MAFWCCWCAITEFDRLWKDWAAIKGKQQYSRWLWSCKPLLLLSTWPYSYPVDSYRLSVCTVFWTRCLGGFCSFKRQSFANIVCRAKAWCRHWRWWKSHDHLHRVVSQMFALDFSGMDRFMLQLLYSDNQITLSYSILPELDFFVQDRMRRLLSELQDPQEQFKAVLVAGTKGKGSVATMLTSILDASQYKAGLYTRWHSQSPMDISPSFRIKWLCQCQNGLLYRCSTSIITSVAAFI